MFILAKYDTRVKRRLDPLTLTVLKIFRGVMPGVFRLASMEPAKPGSRWVTEQNSL